MQPIPPFETFSIRQRRMVILDNARVDYLESPPSRSAGVRQGGDALLQKGQRKLIHRQHVETCPAPATPYQVSVTAPGRVYRGG